MKNNFFRVALGIFATAVFATTASAGSIGSGLLVNGGFEDTPFGGAEEAGAGVGWTTYGAPFRVQQPGPGCDPITCAGPFEGTVSLKIFGDAGAFQDFAATEGESFEGSVWAVNPQNADQLSGSQIGAAAIVFLDAGGGFISDSVSNLLTSSSTVDEWMQLTVSGVAPVGTATVRFQVFTTGGGGGAGRYDAAYFDRAAPIPVPAAVWLMGSALLGLMGMRKKAA